MFNKHKLKSILIIVGFVVFISFFAGYYDLNSITKKWGFMKPGIIQNFRGIRETENELTSTRDAAIIKKDAQLLYTTCGHVEPLNLGDLSSMSLEELKNEFPEGQGWAVRNDNDQIMITKSYNALCSSCENKRHLGAFGDFVAIIKGPVGVEGDIVEVTNIKINDLPPLWQEQIREGELNFTDIQKMFEAMDSLDEYGEH